MSFARPEALLFTGIDWAAETHAVCVTDAAGKIAASRLADLLLEARHPVAPASPDAIKAWRDGEMLSGAKSGAGDAGKDHPHAIRILARARTRDIGRC